jgi:TusA-related sulfurtransferase
MLIPLSLLKVTQRFRALKPGETLEVCWSDPDTPSDLFKVLPDSSYEMIGLDELANPQPSYRLTLVKKK